MKCENCNSDLKKGSKFCSKCGAEVEERPVLEKAPSMGLNKKFLGLGLAVLVLVGGAFGLNSLRDKKPMEEGPAVVEGEQEEETKERKARPDSPSRSADIEVYADSQTKLEDGTDWESKDPKVYINAYGYISSADTDFETEIVSKDGKKTKTVKFLSYTESFDRIVDKIEKNELDESPMMEPGTYVPGPRQRLADDQKAIAIFDKVNKEINTYDLRQKRLKDDEENPIDAEIYTDPTTGDIRKIVSIEYLEDRLLITDYYYLDGKVAFVFKREENYYRPIPAQQDFPGERFYIHEDSLVKYRDINRLDTGGFEKTDYSFDDQLIDWKYYRYMDIESGDHDRDIPQQDPGQAYRDEKADLYRSKEEAIIDEAYTIYSMVQTSANYSIINGYVFDDYSHKLGGVDVKLYLEGEKEPLFTSKTDEEGSYEFKVPNYKKNYFIEIEKDGYIATKIYNVQNTSSTVNLLQETVLMVEETDQSYPVKLRLLDATSGDYYNFTDDGEIRLVFRKGIDNRSGEIAYEENIKFYELEDYSLDLPAGIYTLEIANPGMEQSYKTVYSSPNDIDNVAALMPKIDGEEIKIVLTWDAYPEDLDSHLFMNDGSHICYYQDRVDNGFLDVDDRDGYGPETVTISNLGDGKYKYYVVDFLNALDGDLNSYDMSTSNAKVAVYSKEGMLASFNVPQGRKGVVWDVFEIINGKIVPVQRYYNNIEDYDWW